jgi:LAGLIDADG endonuclease
MSTGLVGSTFSLTDSTEKLKKRIKELNLDGFLHWLTGFSDGESNFIITVNEGTSFSFRFRIQLHQDDHNVLKKIKYELDNLFGQETGNINFDNKENAVIFIITKYEVILNLIIPIFNLYPLRTAKFLDFSDFKQAVLIKQNSLTGKKIARYSENEFEKIMELKNQMNDQRTTVDQNLLLDKPLNPNWVIGFLEGESSFTLKEKTLASTFSVTQGHKSKKIIELLSHFFLNLPFEIPKDVKLLSTLPAVPFKKAGDAKTELNKAKEKIFKYKQANTYIYLDKRDQKSYFKIANRDFQFHCLVPFLERHIFYSRKFLDVQWWILGVKIKIALGYGLSTEAKDLLLRIAINMNDARYSTNKTPPQVPFPTVDEVNFLITELNKNNTNKKYLLQPFNLNKIEEINLITEKKQIYVYDRGQLVSGAPFKNMNEAGIALNTKNPYLNSKLDTGKLYLKRYSFYSKPLA